MEIKIQTPGNKIDIEELLSCFNQTLKDLPRPNNCTSYSQVYGQVYGKDKRKEALAEADKWWGPFIIEFKNPEFVNGHIVEHVSDKERTEVIALTDYICHQKDIIQKLSECLNICLEDLYELQAKVSGRIGLIERKDVKDIDRPDPLEVLKYVREFIEKHFAIKF